MNNWACKLQKSFNEKTEQVDSHKRQDKTNIGRRIFVILLLVYFAAIINVALRGVTSIRFGDFYWCDMGYKLFPIPYYEGWFSPTEPALVPLNQTELFIYLVFINNGIWAFWLGIGTLYVMLPWLPRLQTFVGNLNSRFSHYWSRK